MRRLFIDSENHSVISSRLLTVAIPTYNGARHLTDALKSILSQVADEVDFDLLVCDDQSTDGTVELVRQLAGERARIEVSSHRLGLAGNWNRCVEFSRTPLVAVFHQDDIMRPGHLKSHLAVLQDEAIGMVANAADVIDEDGNEVPEKIVGRGGLGDLARIFLPGEAIPELIEANPFRCSGVTLRKAAHEQLGGFDPTFRYVLDWEFWLRLEKAWKVAWRPEPTVAIRWHVASETHRFKSSSVDLEETTRLLDQFAPLTGPYAMQRKLADERLARAYLNRAYDGAKVGDPKLARRCLRRAWHLSPGSCGLLLKDPKFAGLMALSVVVPGFVKARSALAR